MFEQDSRLESMREAIRAEAEMMAILYEAPIVAEQSQAYRPTKDNHLQRG